MGLMHLGAGRRHAVGEPAAAVAGHRRSSSCCCCCRLASGGLLSNIPETGLALTALEASAGPPHDAGPLAVIAAKLSCAPDVHAIKEALARPAVSAGAEMEDPAVDMGYSAGVLAIFYKGRHRLGHRPAGDFYGRRGDDRLRPAAGQPADPAAGAAAQFGIFATVLGADAELLFGIISFTLPRAAAIGIIGGADGPTAIYLSGKSAMPELGAIAVAAYSYGAGTR